MKTFTIINTLLWFGSSLLCAQELLTNGSFDDASTYAPDGNGGMSLPPGSSTINGWVVTDAELIWASNANVFSITSPFGTHFLDLTGYHDAPPYAGIAQTVATVPDTCYRVRFALGTQQSVPVWSGPIAVRVDAGGASENFTFDPSGSGMRWAPMQMRFTATSESTTIRITGTQAAGGALLLLDDVSVEPLPNCTLWMGQRSGGSYLVDAELLAVSGGTGASLTYGHEILLGQFGGGQATSPHYNLDHGIAASGQSTTGSGGVINGGFEDTEGSFVADFNGIMSLPAGSSIPGWTTALAETVWGSNASVFPIRGPHGNHSIDLTGYHDAAPYGQVFQTISTSPGRCYELRFALGTYQDHPQWLGPVSVLAEAGTHRREFTFYPGGSGNQWGTFALEFIATTPTTRIAFTGTYAKGGALLSLDNVSIQPSERCRFDQWRLAHFGDLDAPQAQADADDDLDQVRLIEEFIFGLNPLIADAAPLDPVDGLSGLPAAEIVQTDEQTWQFMFTVIRHKTVGDYRIQTATSLGTTEWSEGVTYEMTPPVSVSADYERVTLGRVADPLAPLSFARLFVR